MKISILGPCFLLMSTYDSYAQTKKANSSADNSAKMSNANAELEVFDLSNAQWQWMENKNVDRLKDLFDDKCMFVHWVGSRGKEQERNII